MQFFILTKDFLGTVDLTKLLTFNNINLNRRKIPNPQGVLLIFGYNIRGKSVYF